MNASDVEKVHLLIGRMFEAVGLDLAQTWEDMDGESTNIFDAAVDELNALLEKV